MISHYSQKSYISTTMVAGIDLTLPSHRRSQPALFKPIVCGCHVDLNYFIVTEVLTLIVTGTTLKSFYSSTPFRFEPKLLPLPNLLLFNRNRYTSPLLTLSFSR